MALSVDKSYAVAQSTESNRKRLSYIVPFHFKLLGIFLMYSSQESVFVRGCKHLEIAYRRTLLMLWSSDNTNGLSDRV